MTLRSQPLPGQGNTLDSVTDECSLALMPPPFPGGRASVRFALRQRDEPSCVRASARFARRRSVSDARSALGLGTFSAIAPSGRMTISRLFPIPASAPTMPGRGSGWCRAVICTRGDTTQRPALSPMVGRHDPGGPAAGVPPQRPDVLRRPDRAGAGQDHRPGPLNAERAGRVGAAEPVFYLPLEPGELHRRPLALAGPGAVPVLQPGHRIGDAARVRFPAVLRPPRRGLVRDLVPPFPQAVGRPHIPVVVPALFARAERFPDLRHRPVAGEPAGAAVPPEPGGLLRGRFQREPPAADGDPGRRLVVRHRTARSRPAPGRHGSLRPGGRTAGRTRT